MDDRRHVRFDSANSYNTRLKKAAIRLTATHSFRRRCWTRLQSDGNTAMNWRPKSWKSRSRKIALASALLFVLFACFYRLPGPPFVAPPYEEGNLSIVVLDDHEERVADAMITPHGLRAVQDPGSFYSWIDEKHGPSRTFVTNADGIAECVYPKWVSRDSALLTKSVNVVIEHPDYCLGQGVDCEIPKVGTVTATPRIHLHQGGRLRIKAHREGSTETLSEFRALISGESYARSWVADGDAILSSPIVPAEHVLRIVDYSDPDALQFSDPVVFEAIAGQTEELELHLKPGMTIRGELDSPKPVKRGYVVAHISDMAAGPGSKWDQVIHWTTWTTVAEDGQFEFRSLPPTSAIAMLAWCDGFVCQMPKRSTVPLQMGSTPPGRLPQFFALNPDQLFCRISMEACAKCEVTVVDAFGRPIEGINVSFGPNVSYHDNGSWWFGGATRDENIRPKWNSTVSETLRDPKRRWATGNSVVADPDFLNPTYDAKTDASGTAMIANLPGRGAESVDIDSEEYVIRGAEKPPFRSRLEVDLQPGKTSTQTIVVVPRPAITKKMLQPPSPAKGRTLLQHLIDLAGSAFGW